ncbi:hypothetical protein GCM10023147_10990 [Tsukamurella soli]|uniref:HTH arsR-type domain-containing protein n=2 Tax=Tsukamurella soli TaxID=644556 RepID=A0ABP8J905_9ACTN
MVDFVVNRIVDPILQALADAGRRRIVERLSRSPLPASTIAEPMPMSLPAVMKHLAVLEANGIVRSQKLVGCGTYRLEPAARRELEA